MFRVVRRGLVPAAAVAGVLCCTDRTPLAPGTPGGNSPTALITCTATVASKSISCTQPAPSVSQGLKSDVTLGGQGVYVTLRSTNVSFNSGDSIFKGDITVQNLTAQTLGDSAAVVTGVRVFFLNEPAPPVAIVGDSTGTFTTTGQHYFVYQQSIGPFAASASQTWQWNLHGASSFTFSVLVNAKTENDGGVLRWTPQTTTSTFTGIWGATANAVYAVTEEGSIWRFNGTTWKDLPSGGFNGLLGIWGTDTTNIYAVGGNGDILHYDGRSWVKQTSNTSNSLAGIWGSSANNVYAVGDAGTILHNNGTGWSPIVSTDTQNLATVWGASDTAVFATGSAGEFWKFDGATWSKIGSDSGHVNCFSAWGSSNTDVYFACADGDLFHYNGTTVARRTTGQTTPLNGIWGSSASNIYAVGDGGTILRATDNGVTWVPVANSFVGNLLSIWGLNSTTIYTGGKQGTIQKYNGTTLSISTQEHTDALNSVWGTGAGNAYAVGGNGVVIHYNGSSWTTTATLDASALNSVWGSAANDIYAAGAGGLDTAVLYHSTNGTVWTRDSVVVTGDGNVNAVWGASNTSVYAVGDGGVILHGHTGGPWTQQASGTTEDLLGVWGTSDNDVWSVGTNGIILHYDGTSWSSTTHGIQALNGVWAFDANHVFVMSNDGSILTFNGSIWSTLSNASPTPLIAVWGTSATDVYAGGGSTLLHYNGSAWTAQSPGISTATLSFLGIWGSSATDVFAVGSGVYHGVR